MSILTEMEVLQKLKESLEAEGYTVNINPRGMDVPSFLGSLSPDAIAKRGERKLLIEVLSRSRDSQAKLERFRAAIAGHSDWTFLPVWTSGQTVPSTLEPPTQSAIRKKFGEIEALKLGGFLVPAFLAQWSLFEAISRRYMPDQLARYQTPKTLVEKVASMALITNQEASRLRKLIKLRNQAVHGQLDVEVTKNDVAEFDKLLRDLEVTR